MESDFVFTSHGSLWLLLPTNEQAREHLRSHIHAEHQWFGNCLVVEPRYVVDLANNLMNDGFSVEGD